MSGASATSPRNRWLNVKPESSGGLVEPMFGAIFRILSVNEDGERVVLPIVESPERNKFVAVFDENNVDFSIQLDNSSAPSRDMAVELGIHDQTAAFGTRGGSVVELESLSSFGPKFHFLRGSPKDSQTYIGLYARDHGLSYREAEEMLSQIRFSSIMYSKSASRRFIISVKSFEGRSVALLVEGSDTIAELKAKIMSKFGIPANLQCLSYKSRRLSDDGETLRSYGIKKESKLELSLSLPGGFGSMSSEVSARSSVTSSAKSGQGSSSPTSSSNRSYSGSVGSELRSYTSMCSPTDESDTCSVVSSAAGTVPMARGASNKRKRMTTEAPPEDTDTESGTIVFGEHSEQTFQVLAEDFPWDPACCVNDFVVELRFKPSFWNY